MKTSITEKRMKGMHGRRSAEKCRLTGHDPNALSQTADALDSPIEAELQH